jgi:hypothetical protein
MITTLIIIYFCSFRKKNPEQFSRLQRKIGDTVMVIVLLFAVVCISNVSAAQQHSLSYLVKNNGNIIGTLDLSQSKDGDKLAFALKSHIRTSFIFTITAIGIEKSEFNAGILEQSYIYQSLNGSEKVNKRLRRVNNVYLISDNHSESTLNFGDISYNLLCLYTHEPEHINKAYSDKLQKFIPIQKISEHHYRIEFGDDNYNDYYYENGICQKIKVNHLFFTVVMELKKL